MKKRTSLFTSESVTRGHPDKVADQISDRILDCCLAQDPNSKVACEVLVSRELVVIAGEITSSAQVNWKQEALNVFRKVGYNSDSLGFDIEKAQFIINISKQSPDISMGVEEINGKEQGAGDQGIMFGYATSESHNYMPLPISWAHQLTHALELAREEKIFKYLRPDGKSQVTVEYDYQQKPIRIDAVVLSTQHDEKVSPQQLKSDMEGLIKEVIGLEWIDKKTRFFINPTGRFVLGGPGTDCGLTGRKIIVDTYGGMGRHGGGCFSGKDPSKVDRSAAYVARLLAKNIVASGLAFKCEVQLSYAIGYPRPISIKVDSFGTGLYDDIYLADVISEIFDLSPKGIISLLDLKRPIYEKTSFGGHFGRQDKEFYWEKLDWTHKIKEKVEKLALVSI